MKKEEYSLVYKAIHGDSHAYGELIHQYNPYFYKIAFLYVKNEDAAVEIVQDSVYQGYLKIKTLRNPELFSTWMTRILSLIHISEPTRLRISSRMPSSA